jgi:hypothetical protein
MWFNHVIKVEECEMISVSNLWKFITRGAMILCSNIQAGIDIVVPVCDTKRKLSRRSVTAILIQVKNSKHYRKDIDKTLFGGMDYGLPDYRLPRSGTLVEIWLRIKFFWSVCFDLMMRSN